MYELVWQAADPAPAPITASHPAPSFTRRAAESPVAATLALLQLLQSQSQLTAGRSSLSISTRSAASKPSPRQASSVEVGPKDTLPCAQPDVNSVELGTVYKLFHELMWAYQHRFR